MVMNNAVDSVVLKAKYGNDIRKSELHYIQDLNFNDLILMMQRIFQIKSSINILLKYRDSEGDWVTLANDDDVNFAIRHESYLYIEVFNDNNNAKSYSPTHSEVALTTQVAGISINEEKNEHVTTQPSVVQNQIPPPIVESNKQLQTSTPVLQNHTVDNIQNFQQPPTSIEQIKPQNPTFDQQQALASQVSAPQHFQSYGYESQPLIKPPSVVHHESVDNNFYGNKQFAPPSNIQNVPQQFVPPTSVQPTVEQNSVPPSQYGNNVQQPLSPPSSIGQQQIPQYGLNQQDGNKQNFQPQQQFHQQHPGISQFANTNQQGFGNQVQTPPFVSQQSNLGYGPPPPVSSVIGNVPPGVNPFARNPIQNNFGRPPSNFGNYFQ